MKTYRAALVGCSRMGAFIDNEGHQDEVRPLPMSHAASYEACDRTELIACSDLRPEVLEQAGRRYGVPKERQYTDYRKMIEKERPDIVSVATQPEHRAEIVIFAAEQGVRAIYAEKAMAASMAEADAMVEAVERNGVAFNLGSNRRWEPSYNKMKELIDSGRLGALRGLVVQHGGGLFNMGSHMFDLILHLNGDAPVSWVQAHLRDGDEALDGLILRKDPSGQGAIQFESGATAYLVLSPQYQVMAFCEEGTIVTFDDGTDWAIRKLGPPDSRGRRALGEEAFPEFERVSSGVRIIEDLVHALDTGARTRGGVRVARAGTELIFGFVESHVRGGARVPLPLVDSKLRLDRKPVARQPRFQRV